MNFKPLGLIAGRGEMPRQIIQTCVKSGRPVFVLAYHDQTDLETVQGVDHLWLSLGEIGRALTALKKKGVEQIVMAGGITRPALKNLKTDWKGAAFLARLGVKAGAGGLGDDGLLKFLVQAIEQEGFRVLSAQDFLPSFFQSCGPLSDKVPDSATMTDILLGVHVLNMLSPLDIGQSVVVQQGIILGVEAAEGTDALIVRCGGLQKEGLKGTLVKRKKIGQTEQVDLPTIGPLTIENLAKAGLQGVAFQAVGTLVIQPDQVKNRANAYGVFVWGMD